MAALDLAAAMEFAGEGGGGEDGAATSHSRGPSGGVDASGGAEVRAAGSSGGPGVRTATLGCPLIRAAARAEDAEDAEARLAGRAPWRAVTVTLHEAGPASYKPFSR